MTIAKKISFEDWLEKVEDKIYNEQYEIIRKEYGKKKADMANYGWGVDEGNDYIQVTTKVYGGENMSSTAYYPSMKIRHEY